MQVETKYNGLILLDKDPATKEQPKIRVEKPQGLSVQPRPRIDWGKIIGKSPRGLVRPARKLAKLMTEISSKVHKPKTYDEVIYDPIYGNK